MLKYVPLHLVANAGAKPLCYGYIQMHVLPAILGKLVTTVTDIAKETNWSGLLAKLIRLENGLETSAAM